MIFTKGRVTMLKAETDRLDYGSILSPPVDYHLEAAVGTTYSLDLETLTAISIALGLSQATDSELKNNPICLLEALRKVTDKILIFCEAGQIKVPANSSSLYILLEQMVTEVALPNKGKMNGYPAFHPKCWLVQYANLGGDKIYRFIVMSRNMTFDRSWDVSAVLEGKESKDNLEKTKPVQDFLRFLSAYVKKDNEKSQAKKKMLKNLIKVLDNVSFHTNSKEFFDFEVLPLGIGKNAYDINQDSLFLDTFNELIVISPFLTGNIIENLNKDSKSLTNCRRTLITRKNELSKLKQNQVNNFDIFCLKDTIIDGEDSFSDEDIIRQKQDIHAKVYLKRKWSDTDFYLGSMNATYAALNQNVEMMLWLGAKNRYLNSTKLLNDLFGGEEDNPENPFYKTEISDDGIPAGDDEKNKLELMVKKLCRVNSHGEVIKTDDNFTVKITFEGMDEVSNMTISPLRSNKEKELNEEVIFEGLDLLQLSEFYKITVKGEKEELKRIIMISTTGIPSERENSVVNSIVSNKQSFIEYISFVLGEDYLMSYMEKRLEPDSGLNGSQDIPMPAIYEKMLKTAANEPERLDEIEYLLNMITSVDVIPDGFRQMYETFKKAVKIK